MPLRTVVLLVVLALIALFAALNWTAFVAPTTLSFGVAQVQAPLGLIMLGLLAILTALFLLYLAYLQTTVILEWRRHAKLRTHVDTRLTEIESSLSAQLGEMRDRFQR
jgi:uncharacterized integral membrane protein